MSKSRSNRSGRRDVSTIAMRSMPTKSTSSNKFRSRVSLSSIEDRREYNPEGQGRPARSFNKSRHRLVVPKSSSVIFRPMDLNDPVGLFSIPSVVAFRAPKKVLILCKWK